jgi:hypothetical protein
MILMPRVVSLVLCEKFEVNASTRQLSLVGIFHTRQFERFPSPPQRFTVYAALSDAAGEGRMRLEMTRLETQEWIYSYERWFAFPPDRLLLVNLEIPVKRCVFPAAGRYAVKLLFDGEVATERALVIEDKPKGRP